MAKDKLDYWTLCESGIKDTIVCVSKNWDKRNVILITPRVYWEERKCQFDGRGSEEVDDALETIGFGESSECTYDSVDGKKYSRNALKAKLIELGFEYNMEFQEFCDKCDC